MRKVRMYLRKIDYLSHADRKTTFQIFVTNTRSYLEGKITKKFYTTLAEELIFNGDYHFFWKDQHDPLVSALTKALELKTNHLHPERVREINEELARYLKPITCNV